MTVKSANYSGSFTAGDTHRGPSPEIWHDFNALDFLEDPSKGMHVFEDFLGTSNIPTAAAAAIAQGFNDNFSIYAYQGATIVDGAAEGGVITMGSDGDNEGVALGPTAGWARITTTSTLALNQKLWFEARWARSSVTATKGDFFVGLIDSFLTSGVPTAAIPITVTDNTLADVNLIGFHSKGNAPTEVSFVYKLKGQSVVYPTNLTTLMASSGDSVLTDGKFVKTGFLFDPDATPRVISSASTGQTVGTVRKPLIRIFINGRELPAFLTTENVQGTAFPTGFMGQCMAVLNQTGSTPPTMSCDWIRVAQKANS